MICRWLCSSRGVVPVVGPGCSARERQILAGFSPTVPENVHRLRLPNAIWHRLSAKKMPAIKIAGLSLPLKPQKEKGWKSIVSLRFAAVQINQWIVKDRSWNKPKLKSVNRLSNLSNNQSMTTMSGVTMELDKDWIENSNV